MAKINKKERTHGEMFWKGVALAFVAVFCIIIIFSLVRLYHFEPHRTAVQPSQVDLAEKAVAKELNNSGDSISNYNLQVSDMARGFSENDANKSIIQISLYDHSKRHLYLVDADSGQIVMHSETTFYGWMENQTPPIPPRPEPFWGK